MNTPLKGEEGLRNSSNLVAVPLRRHWDDLLKLPQLLLVKRKKYPHLLCETAGNDTGDEVGEGGHCDGRLSILVRGDSSSGDGGGCGGGDVGEECDGLKDDARQRI